MSDWEQEMRKTYTEQLEKMKTLPARWDMYHTRLISADMRLWRSLDDLDITLAFIGSLIIEARRREGNGLKSSLHSIYQHINAALDCFCPIGWKGPVKVFDDLSLHESSLRQARALLAKALEIWNEVYFKVSLELEAKRNEQFEICTPLVWKFLNDAIYGLDKYLAEAAKGTDRGAFSSSGSHLDTTIDCVVKQVLGDAAGKIVSGVMQVLPPLDNAEEIMVNDHGSVLWPSDRLIETRRKGI